MSAEVDAREPAVRVLNAALPGHVVRGLADARQALGVDRSGLLVLAHAALQARLSGTPDVTVTTGAVAVRHDMLGSWRTASSTGQRHAQERVEPDTAPGGAVEGRLRWTVDSTIDGSLPPGVDLDIGWASPQPDTDWAGTDDHAADPAPASVVVRFRTDAVAPEVAEQLLGYHLRGLRHLAADVDSPLATVEWVDADDVVRQRTLLGGPRRPLPVQVVHQLFEERVREHPDRIAAQCGEDTWSYADLDRAANRLGNALLAAGLAAEDVVAVVTDRDLGWMAAVLGVLKAGGTYLPVEPDFPVSRIAQMLARSGCSTAMTGGGTSVELVERAFEAAGVVPTRTIDVPETLAADLPVEAERPVGVDVSHDQSAYVFFTSGSTGEPKGAQCEHAGMLNHMLGKIEDTGLDESSVVAQTGPQCFDISLWQLLAAVLVGGRTVIVQQADILDVNAFVRRVRTAEVDVLQLVPSYLEVVLDRLASGTDDLPSLRLVSATGEALGAGLVRRWFDTMPHVPLLNTYGLTETSDDTNHHLLTRPPPGQVPVGRPVRNVDVYVVDQDLRLVPRGAVGEIVFSGVCVGRGYTNDVERTAAAFVESPYWPGERLYRSGDRGRWRPDGTLEFLGRVDHQVKVNGFRIELGEVEAHLEAKVGVRLAASVVAQGHPGAARLIAFYTGDPRPEEELRSELAASLPDYMVPSVIRHLPRLPLTGNGKIDRAALSALVEHSATAQVQTSGAARREATADEVIDRVTDAWAQVLGLPRSEIGPHGRFRDLGGTSLAAIKLVLALDGAVELQDVVANPTVAELVATMRPGASMRAPVEPRALGTEEAR